MVTQGMMWRNAGMVNTKMFGMIAIPLSVSLSMSMSVATNMSHHLNTFQIFRQKIL